jgi:ADP-ribosylglycohydrolase/fructose-1,6-bisphosphatase/inositol monophosphatase family enzyme
VPDDYRRPLEVAIDAALKAGAILRADLHLPGGPRGHDAHADADTEAEQVIRGALTTAFPSWGYLGEETGSQPRAAGEPHIWLVDPNDGTRDYLKGHRGSAVSIALLRDGVPVLGVVYAFAAPDDGGDLIAWAEGCGPVRRDGREVIRSGWPAALARYNVVLLSEAMNRKPKANLDTIQPARGRAMPSIAYRLALAAAGDGDVTVSLNGPVGWDYAAGHALLRGAGGDFVDQDGHDVGYTPDGGSSTTFCFGGAPALVRDQAARNWEAVLKAPRPTDEPYGLVSPVPGLLAQDAGLLARAQGCLLGQLAGDALGSLVEFQSPGEISRRYPGGIHAMADGGTWNTLAGQPTDDSELALALARSIAKAGQYGAEPAAHAYYYWYHSHPFDCGGTTAKALAAIGPLDVERRQTAAAASQAASKESQANGSLMRVSPLAIWGHALPPARLAECARTDSGLTHPHRICCDAVAVFAVAVAHAIRTGERAARVYAFAMKRAEELRCCAEVRTALGAAAAAPPGSFMERQGWVLVALQNAFHHLLHAGSVEEGVVRTVMSGGDTDTNAAITGALIGAVQGRAGIPAGWRNLILTCRPVAGLPAVHRPRPRPFWPVDALELAERLVCLGVQESENPA